MLGGLQQLRRQRHDTIVLHLLDRAEMDFPFERPAVFKGLEGWPELVADPRSLRPAYLRELDSYLKAMRRACREAEIEYRLVRTDQPLDMVLSALLAARMVKIR